jgi:molybdopterin molybdotransferase
MISFEEAIETLMRTVRPLEPRRIALDDLTVGTVLAEAVLAPEEVPSAPTSTMDGYAVIASDASPRRRVLAEAEAGRRVDVHVGPGECTRIMTGAPLPHGTDAVIPVEQTQESDGWMATGAGVGPGTNVRAVGSDVARGQRVLERGTALTPAAIGILATLGLGHPLVYPQPRVAILATGDELAPQGASLDAGQIRDSNSYTLAAAIRALGCDVTRSARIADTYDTLRQAIEEAVQGSDLVLSTGGVSMGTRDLVKPVLEELGTVHFGRVAIKPGLPVTYATVAGVPVIGLPGNPVSTLVGFEVVVRPVLRAMAHRAARWRPERPVTLRHAIRHEASRLEFQRALVECVDGVWYADTTGAQVSSRLLSLVGANALLRIPRGTGDLPAGTVVTAIFTDEGETDVAP